MRMKLSTAAQKNQKFPSFNQDFCFQSTIAGHKVIYGTLEHVSRESKEIRRNKERRNGIEEKNGNEMKYGDFISLASERR
jgi:hypothetical protein